MSTSLMKHTERAERKRKAPTPALAIEASRKALAGDERAKNVLKRWIIDHPDEMIRALDNAIAQTFSRPTDAAA